MTAVSKVYNNYKWRQCMLIVTNYSVSTVAARESPCSARGRFNLLYEVSVCW